jgi:fibronectin type 3 domain-containing protein
VKIAEVEDVDSFIDTTAKAGTTYTYTVVSVCDEVKGFYDEDGITYKRLSKVTTESATNTADGVKVTWKPVSKCSGYRVYRKTEDGSWKRIATVNGSTKSYYTDKTAKSGTKYVYKVVAYSGSYTSYYTELSHYYLDTPELLSAKSGKSGITAKWETVKGASGYYVYRKEGNGSYKKLATVKGASKYSYLDKSAKKGRTYTYKVKAYYSKTTSAYSNTKTVNDKY